MELIRNKIDFIWYDNDVVDTLKKQGKHSTAFMQFPSELMEKMIDDPYIFLKDKDYKVIATKSIEFNKNLKELYESKSLEYFGT